MKHRHALDLLFFLAAFGLIACSLAQPLFDHEFCQVSYITVPGPTVTDSKEDASSKLITVTVFDTSTRTVHPDHPFTSLAAPFSTADGPKLKTVNGHLFSTADAPKLKSVDGDLFPTASRPTHFKPSGVPFSTVKAQKLGSIDAGLFSTAPTEPIRGLKTHETQDPTIYSAQVTPGPVVSTEFFTYYTTFVITVVPYEHSFASSSTLSTVRASKTEDITTTTIFETSFVTIQRTSTIVVPFPTASSALGSGIVDPVFASNSLPLSTVIVPASRQKDSLSPIRSSASSQLTTQSSQTEPIYPMSLSSTVTTPVAPSIESRPPGTSLLTSTPRSTAQASTIAVTAQSSVPIFSLETSGALQWTSNAPLSSVAASSSVAIFSMGTSKWAASPAASTGTGYSLAMTTTSISTPVQSMLTSVSLSMTASTVPVFTMESSTWTTSPIDSTRNTVPVFTMESMTWTASPIHSTPASLPTSSTRLSMSTAAYPTTTTTTTTTTTASSSAAGPAPSECGEYGNFTLNWDDEPQLTTTEPQSHPRHAVFNPYHQLFFSNGYAYTSTPESPFQAISLPNMAIFLPNDTTDIGSPYAAGNKPGEIGAGPRASLNAFWFNAYGAYLGCEHGGATGCVMDIRGYKWDAAALTERLAAQHVQRLPACPGLSGCHMTYVDLDESFAALTGIQIWATANGATPRAFFVDNLDLGWYNNSCAAGLYRITSRK